jgi:hypothetical protein
LETARSRALKAVLPKFNVDETVPPVPLRIAPLVVVGSPFDQLAALDATPSVPIHVVAEKSSDPLNIERIHTKAKQE